MSLDSKSLQKDYARTSHCRLSDIFTQYFAFLFLSTDWLCAAYLPSLSLFPAHLSCVVPKLLSSASDNCHLMIMVATMLTKSQNLACIFIDLSYSSIISMIIFGFQTVPLKIWLHIEDDHINWQWRRKRGGSRGWRPPMFVHVKIQINAHHAHQATACSWSDVSYAGQWLRVPRLSYCTSFSGPKVTCHKLVSLHDTQ